MCIWILQCFVVWSIMGVLIIVCLPAPRTKLGSLMQALAGGPLIWATVIVALHDMDHEREKKGDDNEDEYGKRN